MQAPKFGDYHSDIPQLMLEYFHSCTWGVETNRLQVKIFHVWIIIDVVTPKHNTDTRV